MAVQFNLSPTTHKVDNRGQSSKPEVLNIFTIDIDRERGYYKTKVAIPFTFVDNIELYCYEEKQLVLVEARITEVVGDYHPVKRNIKHLYVIQLPQELEWKQTSNRPVSFEFNNGFLSINFPIAKYHSTIHAMPGHYTSVYL